MKNNLQKKIDRIKVQKKKEILQSMLDGQEGRIYLRPLFMDESIPHEQIIKIYLNFLYEVTFNVRKMGYSIFLMFYIGERATGESHFRLVRSKKVKDMYDEIDDNPFSSYRMRDAEKFQVENNFYLYPGLKISSHNEVKIYNAFEVDGFDAEKVMAPYDESQIEDFETFPIENLDVLFEDQEQFKMEAEYSPTDNKVYVKYGEIVAIEVSVGLFN